MEVSQIFPVIWNSMWYSPSIVYINRYVFVAFLVGILIIAQLLTTFRKGTSHNDKRVTIQDDKAIDVVKVTLFLGSIDQHFQP